MDSPFLNMQNAHNLAAYYCKKSSRTKGAFFTLKRLNKLTSTHLGEISDNHTHLMGGFLVNLSDILSNCLLSRFALGNDCAYE